MLLPFLVGIICCRPGLPSGAKHANESAKATLFAKAQERCTYHPVSSLRPATSPDRDCSSSAVQDYAIPPCLDALAAQREGHLIRVFRQPHLARLHGDGGIATRARASCCP